MKTVDWSKWVKCSLLQHVFLLRDICWCVRNLFPSLFTVRHTVDLPAHTHTNHKMCENKHTVAYVHTNSHAWHTTPNTSKIIEWIVLSFSKQSDLGGSQAESLAVWHSQQHSSSFINSPLSLFYPFFILFIHFICLFCLLSCWFVVKLQWKSGNI